MNIVFFGTSRFAAEILEDLVSHGFLVAAIVTRMDKPKGRNLILSPPPVKEIAQKKFPHIPVFQPIKASVPEFEEVLKALKPDLFVVAFYGEIIKKNILSIPAKGCINVHPSLLPKYRGATPIHQALLHGDPVTGVCIIEMTEAMDAGDILGQEEIRIELSDNHETLELKLIEVAKKLLKHVVKDISKNIYYKIPQDPAQVVMAPKMPPEREKIDWYTSSKDIFNTVRAFAPRPGAWSLIKIGEESKRLKILKARPAPELHGLPGAILSQKKDQLIVACSKGALELLEVQPEGKKKLSIQEFLSGLHKPLLFQ